MTAPEGFNVLREIVENASVEADRLEQEADKLEAQAHAMRMRASQLRAVARANGRFG